MLLNKIASNGSIVQSVSNGQTVTTHPGDTCCSYREGERKDLPIEFKRCRINVLNGAAVCSSWQARALCRDVPHPVFLGKIYKKDPHRNKIDRDRTRGLNCPLFTFVHVEIVQPRTRVICRPFRRLLYLRGKPRESSNSRVFGFFSILQTHLAS